jgi:lipoteichoic acid synthase
MPNATPPSPRLESNRMTSPRARWSVRLVAAAALLCLAQLAPRAYILSHQCAEYWAGSHNPAKALLQLALCGVYDVAYVAVIAGICLALLVPLARIKGIATAVYVLLLIVATLSLLVSMVNARVVDVLGYPFTYQWFYYSGFLQSVSAKQVLQNELTPSVGTTLIEGCVAYVAISLGLGSFAISYARRLTPQTLKRIAVWVCLAFVAYFPLSYWYVSSRNWPYDKLANPVYAFASSWLTADRAPMLFTMHTEFGEDEFAPPKAAPPSALPAERPTIRNVVVVVLESVPAEYVDGFGSEYAATPNIGRWAKHAAVFDNIYVSAPISTLSLSAILCFVYPWISYRVATEDKPDIDLPSITSRLEERGFASGCFYSGDVAYQGAGAFARARGFDVVQDYTQRHTNRRLYFPDGELDTYATHELSTAESLTSWFDEQRRADKPVFALMWTVMTHHPYLTDEAESVRYDTKDPSFDRYLNALNRGDEAFGRVMRYLEEERILDETLVVVVGDHGQAFGRHDQIGHASKLYEENCHVPLVLINPKLFSGQRYETVGGLVDIAPTLADVMGEAPADTWQGRSLFRTDRPNRTYFFSPWWDRLFGYRDGNMKFIYNATRDTYELYDLATDPREERNIIESHRDEIDGHVRRLAAWVQYQNKLYDRLLGNQRRQ